MLLDFLFSHSHSRASDANIVIIANYRPYPKEGEGYIFTLCVSPHPLAGTAVRVRVTVAGGMPLALTQEDFLVLSLCEKFDCVAKK